MHASHHSTRESDFRASSVNNRSVKILSRLGSAVKYAHHSITSRLSRATQVTKEKLKKVKDGFLEAYESDIKAIKRRAFFNFLWIVFLILFGAIVFAVVRKLHEILPCFQSHSLRSANIILHFSWRRQTR